MRIHHYSAQPGPPILSVPLKPLKCTPLARKDQAAEPPKATFRVARAVLGLDYGSYDLVNSSLIAELRVWGFGVSG